MSLPRPSNDMPLDMRSVAKAVDVLRAAVGYTNPQAAEAIGVLQQHVVDHQGLADRLRVMGDTIATQNGRLATHEEILEPLVPLAGLFIQMRVNAYRSGYTEALRHARILCELQENRYSPGSPRNRAYDRARLDIKAVIEYELNKEQS